MVLYRMFQTLSDGASLAVSDAEREYLKKEVTDYTYEMQQNVAKLVQGLEKESQKEIQIIREQLSFEKSERNKAELENKELRKQLELSKKENENCSDRIKQTIKKNDKALKDQEIKCDEVIRKLEDKVDELLREQDSNKKLNEEQAKRVEDLNSELEKCQDEKENLNNQLKSNNDKCEEDLNELKNKYETEQAGHKNNVDESQSDLITCQKDRDELSVKVGKLEKEKKDALAKYEKCQRDLKEEKETHLQDVELEKAVCEDANSRFRSLEIQLETCLKD